MEHWYRVFGTNDREPDPGDIVEFLNSRGFTVRTCRLQRDDQGWFTAEILLEVPLIQENDPIRVNRYLTSEEGIRSELNSWAASVEAIAENADHGWLMQHLISTTQLFTFLMDFSDLDDFKQIRRFAGDLAGLLARLTDGVYQVDNEGFFTPDGTLLLRQE